MSIWLKRNTMAEDKMQKLVDRLNQASDAYYNGKGEIMTDYEWDYLFDQLKQLEKETGMSAPGAPCRASIR